MANHIQNKLKNNVFVLTELELSFESQSDTCVSVVGVFSSYDKALKTKNEKIYEKSSKYKLRESKYEVYDVSFCYEISGKEGYFYQLLIIEKSIS